MIINKIVNTIEETELEILGVTLLSIEEAWELPKRLRKHEYWWWLRSPGMYQDYAACVHNVGSVSYLGNYVRNDFNYIRPALKINLESSDLKIGDCFIFADKEFEIISEDFAFCKSDIGYYRFDRESNDYDTSEIKEYIEDWFKSNI